MSLEGEIANLLDSAIHWFRGFIVEEVPASGLFGHEAEIADWDRRFKMWLATQPVELRRQFDPGFAAAEHLAMAMHNSRILFGPPRRPIPGSGMSRLG